VQESVGVNESLVKAYARNGIDRLRVCPLETLWYTFVLLFEASIAYGTCTSMYGLVSNFFCVRWASGSPLTLIKLTRGEAAG